LLPHILANGLAVNQFFPTRSSLKHLYHPHGYQPCYRQLDRQPGTPRTESPSVGGPVPQVLCQVGGGFGSSTTSRRRIWVIYDKSEEDLYRLPQVGGGFGSSTTSRSRICIVYYKSEEDLDHLLQVGEGLAGIHRRAPVPADYSDFINDVIPLPNGHHGLIAPPSWSGGPGHRKGMSPPTYPAQPNLLGLPPLSGGPGHWKGTIPPSYPAQATFLCPHHGRAGQGIRRPRVLQATRLRPPFCPSILFGRARALEGHESSKLLSSAHLPRPTTWSGGPEHWKGTSPPSYPAQPTFLRFQPGRAGSGIGRARSPPSYLA
jgi:hypothetical protein